MENEEKVIVFTLNEQRYALNVHQVLSIEKFQKITMIPGTAAFVKGVMNLRGEVIPIIDLKKRLDVEETEQTEDDRILIVHENDIRVGLMVDAATDVLDIQTESIEPATNTIGSVNESYIKGIANLENGLLILLDLESILEDESLKIDTAEVN